MRTRAALFLFLTAAPLAAQAPHCVIPAELPEPRLTRPEPGAVRNTRPTHYLLALSWSPQFCRDRGGDPEHASQCGPGARFGFILHGLWPDGPGRDDPAWCAAPTRVARDTLRRHFCMTPSVDLLQHEWAKHGTCMARDPERYFRAGAILYRSLRWPDMRRLSFDRVSVDDFRGAFARANPGVPANAVLVQTTRGGWLREVQVCYGRDFRPRACPRGESGADGRQRLKIWRDER